MNAKLVLFIVGTLLIVMTALMAGYKVVQVVQNYQNQQAQAIEKALGH